MAGWVKININVAEIVYGRWRLGAVFRNESGTMMAIDAKESSGFHKADVAESLALRWAVELTVHNGYTTLEVESDCVVVVNAFHHDHDVSMMELIIQDLRLLFGSFSFFSMNFICRSCNIVAHHVAKYRCGLAFVQWWWTRFTMTVMFLSWNRSSRMCDCCLDLVLSFRWISFVDLVML